MTMFSFQPQLSTQDIFFQLQSDIIDSTDIINRLTSSHKRVILILDIKGAFDRVLHSAILAQLTSLGCGEQTYNYLRAFFTDHAATFGFGYLRTSTFRIPAKGTPLGSVSSTLLFNIGMKDLQRKLQTIPHIKHASHTDDLTVWTPTGYDREQEDAFQQAVTVTLDYRHSQDLQRAPKKSALLTLHSQPSDKSV